MGDLRAAQVVGPSGRGSAPPSRSNDLNLTTKITHSIFFYLSVSTFASASLWRGGEAIGAISQSRIDGLDESGYK